MRMTFSGKGFELGENWVGLVGYLTIFSRKAHRRSAQKPSEMRIVHSHERQSSTIPFIQYRLATSRGPFFLSRVKEFFYDHLERRELL